MSTKQSAAKYLEVRTLTVLQRRRAHQCALDLLDSRKRAEEPRERDASAADDEWEDFSTFDFPDPLAGAVAGDGEAGSVQARGIGTFVPSVYG